jgi:hypothetical protein
MHETASDEVALLGGSRLELTKRRRTREAISRAARLLLAVDLA